MISLGLNWVEILLLVMVSLTFILVKALNKKLRRYLNVHWILDAFYDGMMWIPMFLIGNEFFEGWISAILVVGCMAMVEQLKKRNGLN